MTLTPARRRRPRRSRRVWPLAVAGALVLAVVLAAALVPSRTHDVAATTVATTGDPATTVSRTATTRPVPPLPRRLAEHRTGALGTPVQDAAATRVPGGVMLLGGLTAADQSRQDVVVATATRDRSAGTLPTALHDTAAVTIGGFVYLFGGGTGANTQSDEIVRVPVAGGSASVVGRLPAPSSDQAAVAVGGTAYVVGGYTGTRWLDTIVAWRPGRPARVVAHLPRTLRYAAVAASGSTIVIAGGSLEDGSASNEVLAYRAGSRAVRRLGKLPAPTTHAAAAALGGVVYVIGGRGAAVGTPVARIVAVDVARRRVRAAGSLGSPRSDLAAVALGSRILLAGGRGTSGTEATLAELVPSAAPARASAPRQTESNSTLNVYANDGANALTGAARQAKELVYVPNSGSNTVDVIDPHTYKVVDHFAVGGLPQHVVPAWDLRTLYVTNDTGNTLTPIDPRTGKPGATIPVEDPYNMYFTPDGRYAIVVAERLHRLDFRDPHSFALRRSLDVPCLGVDHMDFSANGRYALASCEFSGKMVVVDVRGQRVVRTIQLPDGYGGMPQDVKLSPDGRIYYVADMRANGLWEIDAHTYRILRFQPTGAGAHGLYPSRDARYLYVSNRNAGTVSVLRFSTRKIVATWSIPGGTPDMGGVSADGKVLWLSGRYRSEVYAISTRTGKLLARIPVGAGPHGLSVWPQPGRYSLGHTGILR